MLSHIVLVEPAPGELDELASAFRAACEHAELTRATDADMLLGDAVPEGTVVVLDRDLGDGTLGGDELTARLRARQPRMPIVVTARAGDVQIAQRAIVAGATDFLVRGPSLVERVSTLAAKLSGVLTLLEENRELRR